MSLSASYSRACLFALLATAITSAGCIESSQVSAPPAKTATASAAPPAEAAIAPAPGSTPVAPDQVALQTGNEELLAEVIKKHKGKLVFVDFWATWCGPCVESFPHTVELHQKYGDKGLAVVSVSFDQLEKEAEVRGFLGEQGAAFDNILSSYGGALVDAAEGFDFEGALPHFRLYGKDGELLAKWDGKPENIEAEIERMLSESPAVAPAQ